MSTFTLIQDLVFFVYNWLITTLHPNELKLGLALFAAWPLGIYLAKLNDAKTRYCFGLAVGLLLELFVFREEIIHTLIPTTLTYLLVLRFQRKCVAPVIIAVSVYSSAYQVYRSLQGPQIFDFNTGISLMMKVWKYIAFAWAYRDGGIPKNELSADQNYRKIETFPPALEFYSYIFFFPCTLVGPIFDFREYQLFVNKQESFKDIPHYKGNLLSIQSVVFGLLAGIGAEVFEKYFHPQFALSDEFMSRSYFYRLGFILISGYTMRFRVYAGFYIAQAAVDTSGLSFTGYNDGKPVFDRILTTARYAELTANAAEAIKRWNSSTQACLSRYVYNRVIDYDRKKGNKHGTLHAAILTFFVASTWHGFELHCYFTFLQLLLLIYTAKAVYRARHKFEWIPKYISLPIRYIGTVVPGNLITAGLATPNIFECLKLYSTVYWLPILMNVAILIALKLLGWDKSHKRHQHHTVEAKHHHTRHQKTEGKRFAEDYISDPRQKRHGMDALGEELSLYNRKGL